MNQRRALGEGDPDKVEVDAFGHARKLGVVEPISEAIKAKLGMTARHDKPSYLQRSFAEMQSSADREEAYQAGRAAVRAALAGESDKMVSFVRQPGSEYVIEYGLAPLSEVANAEKMLPAEYINEAGNGVTEAFVEYARPLIGGPLQPYGRLAKNLVAKKTAS